MTEKSRVKFTRSPETGELIGFVSQQSSGKLRGVMEDSPCKKRICVLSEDLKGTIIPKQLYDVTLRAMHNGNGYVVISAEPKTFPATIETTVEHGVTYRVTVKFGHKTIFYDPWRGRSNRSKTKEGVLGELNNRHDISDLDNVISDFIDQADELLRIMKEDGYDVCSPEAI